MSRTHDKPDRKELVTLRVSPQQCDEARSIARVEGESQSTIFRRLIRYGLETARRELRPGDGEAA